MININIKKTHIDQTRISFDESRKINRITLKNKNI